MAEETKLGEPFKARIEKILCANCQEETDHALEVDKNGETVATCHCGRFVKFAAGADLAALIALHGAHNLIDKKK